jgi:hypothetical protein
VKNVTYLKTAKAIKIFIPIIFEKVNIDNEVHVYFNSPFSPCAWLNYISVYELCRLRTLFFDSSFIPLLDLKPQWFQIQERNKGTIKK